MPDERPFDVPAIIRPAVVPPPLTQERTVVPAPIRPVIPSRPIQEAGSDSIKLKEKQSETIGVKQFEVTEGGSTIEQIRMTEDTRKKAADIIERRLNATIELNKDEPHLTPIDLLVLNKGRDLTERLRSGQTTKDDFNVTRAIIRDDLIQRATATSRLITETPGRLSKIKTIPIIGLLSGAPNSELTKNSSSITVEPPVTETTGRLDKFKRGFPKLLSRTPKAEPEDKSYTISSPYLKHIGFSDWKDDRIEETILELNETRKALEFGMYGKGFRDPLFDDVSTSLFASDFAHQTGDKLNDATVRALLRLVELRHEGKSFKDLWDTDQKEAFSLLLEANTNAITSIASETARDLLTSNKPGVNIDTIEAHAKKLDEPPKQEELKPLETELEQKQDALAETKEELTYQRNKLKSLKRQLPDIENEFNKAEAIYNNQHGNAVKTISDFRDQLTRIDNDLKGLPQDTTLDKTQAAQRTQDRTRLQRERESALGYLNKAVKREHAITTAYFTSKANKESCIYEIRKLEGVPATEDKPAEKGIIEIAQETYNAKIIALREIEEQHAQKQKEITEGGSSERKNKARALRSWGKAAKAENFEKIMEARNNRGFENEFAISSLTNMSISSEDQVEGAERIREHIFRLIEGAEYNPETAREMLSDETIAHAIVYVLGLQKRFEAELTSFSNNKKRLETARRTIPPVPADISTTEIALKKSARGLLGLTFSEFAKGNQFQISDTINFMISQGLTSAQRGNPYLQIEERFIK